MHARHSAAAGHGAHWYAIDDEAPAAGTWQMEPEDRVGAPLARPKRRLLRRFVMLLLAGSSVWLWYDGRAEPLVEPYVVAAVDWARSVMPSASGKPDGVAGGEGATPASRNADRLAAEALPQTAVAEATPDLPALEQVEPKEVPAVAGVPATPEASPAETGGTGATDADRAAGGQKAPPVATTVRNPLQKRAEAVGLHPEISAAVLARLSADDFRNAGIAIAKAVKETPDEAILEFPLRPKAGLAKFRVHFVEGAGVNCRRYVVSIAKDGWLTTALPIERCGVKAPSGGGKLPPVAAKG